MSIYLLLFLEFFKMGALTFGGGYAMIPFIEETVLSHGWLTTGELVNFIAVSESTPGAFAVNISTYVGSEVGGLFGSLCATVGLVLPPFVIILIIAKCYERFKESLIVRGVMLGLKSTVVGLIAATVLKVGYEVLFPLGFSFENLGAELLTGNFWFIIVVFAVMLFLLLYKKLNPILIIVLSAAAGILAGYTGLISV
ncbi:MAG: chromate transporter [Ruminococcus sp.]|nr:chromate transporter [Ruminococcus sp.]